MSNDVSLNFAGDASRLTSAFDQVGSASRGMADDVDRASRDAASSLDTVDGAVGGTGEKAGDLESGFRGVTDSMAGFSAIAQGDVLGGLTDLAGGAEALATGFTGVVLPAIKSMSKEMIGNAVASVRAKAAMVGNKVATLASAAATRVMTLAQKGLNLAMRMNPIGIIITLIAALVIGIVIAYKKSETFRRIVDAAFRGVQKAAKFVWDWIKDNWKTLLTVLTGPIGIAVRVISHNWDRIKSGAGKLVSGIKSVLRGLAEVLTAPFRAAFGAIRSLWNSTIGGFGFSIPGWVPEIGGSSFTIPSMHTGGVMPGAPGTAGLAYLMAGERIIPPGGRGGGASVIEIRSSGRKVDDMLVELLREAIRVKGGNVQVVLGKSGAR